MLPLLLCVCWHFFQIVGARLPWSIAQHLCCHQWPDLPDRCVFHITSTHPISLFPASYQDGSAHGHCTHWYSAWIGWSLYIKSLFFFQYQDQIQTATAHVKVQRIAMEGKHQECPTHQGWVPCPLEQGRTCSFPLSRPTMCGPRHHPHYWLDSRPINCHPTSIIEALFKAEPLVRGGWIWMLVVGFGLTY